MGGRRGRRPTGGGRRVPRSLPPFAHLPAPPARRAPLLDLEIAVVTPMFGGGPTPRVVDDEQPINGKAVRGHLRFWWRACVAHQYANAADLFNEEASLWGTVPDTRHPTHQPAAIEVEVVVINRGEESAGFIPNAYRWADNRYPTYALFPFQGDQKRLPVKGRCGVTFRLRLCAAPGSRVPQADLERAAKAAVWAWLCFGGVGARTRRGLGSLFCLAAHTGQLRDFQPTGPIDKWLSAQAKDHLNDPTRPAVPMPITLPSLFGARLFLHQSSMNVLDAWAESVGVMQRLRQGVPEARPGPDPRFPGRSRWPEADSIRQIAGQHIPRYVPTHPARVMFPRAEFGLPIVFHFKQDKPRAPNPIDWDPDDHTLQVALSGASRMASPVILKPITTAAGQSAGNERARPVVLFLRVPSLTQLQYGGSPIPLDLVQGGPPRPVANPNEVVDPARAGMVSPLRGRPSALAALADYVMQQWHPTRVDLS